MSNLMLPVVAIGASEDDLDAVRWFLNGLPVQCRAAFLVDLHPHRADETNLADIIAQHPRLRLLRAEAGAKLSPNTLCVAPPGKVIRIADGAMSLTPRPPAPRTGLDTLFHNLADAYGPRAIGVILSWDDKRPLPGAEAILRAGGIVMAPAVTPEGDAHGPPHPAYTLAQRLGPLISHADDAAKPPGPAMAGARQAATIAERSRDDLANLTAASRSAVLFFDRDLRLRRMTPAAREMLGLRDDMVGQTLEAVAAQACDGDLITPVRACHETQAETETQIEIDGTDRVLLRRLSPYRLQDGAYDGVTASYTDITDLERSREQARRRERQQEAVAQLGLEALSGAPPSRLFATAVNSVAEHLGTRFVKVLQIDPDKKNLTLRGATGWKPEAVVDVTRIESETGSQAGFTLLQSSPVVVQDFRTEKRFAAPRFLRDHGILCGASVIIGPLSAPWGVLGAHETEIGRCAFSADDLNFLQAVANVLWFAILGDDVAREQHHERRQLRELTDTLPMRFAIVDADERYEFVNSAHLVDFDDRSALEGKTISATLDPDAYEKMRPYVRRALAGEPQEYELSMVPAEGAAAQDLLVRHVPRFDDDVVTGFYSAVVDITRQRAAERESLERLAHYRAVGDTVPFGVWTADAKGHVTFLSDSFLAMTGQGEDSASGLGWLDSISPGTRDESRAAWKADIERVPWEREQQVVAADGRLAHVLMIGRPVRNSEGHITSWAGFNLDITRRKEEEERLALISAELDHRVKNMLATVTTISRMTARGSETLDEYRKSLDDRLQAMANAHQVLAESDWRGMALKDLLMRELRPYMAPGSDRVTLSGPDVFFHPEPTQTLALTFHEMVTNAAKYGALSRDTGRLSIDWGWSEGPARAVALTWTETGMTGVTEPRSQGFGTTMIERVLSEQYGAEVSADYRPSGLVVSMTLPEALLKA